MAKDHLVAVRFSGRELDAIEAMKEQLEGIPEFEAAGNVSISMVIRLAVKFGLATMEKRYGSHGRSAGPKPRRKRKRR